MGVYAGASADVPARRGYLAPPDSRPAAVTERPEKPVHRLCCTVRRFAGRHLAVVGSILGARW
jgi:hypothetical protein